MVSHQAKWGKRVASVAVHSAVAYSTALPLPTRTRVWSYGRIA
jgi:hypothetical protein